MQLGSEFNGPAPPNNHGKRGLAWRIRTRFALTVLPVTQSFPVVLGPVADCFR
jgi:hypothetical protein